MSGSLSCYSFSWMRVQYKGQTLAGGFIRSAISNYLEMNNATPLSNINSFLRWNNMQLEKDQALSRCQLVLYPSSLVLFYIRMFCYSIWSNYACFASSCMAKHIFYVGKSVMLHLCEGPDYGCTTDRIDKITEEKSPAPGGIRTHYLSVTRRALYHCATTADQLNTQDVKNRKFCKTCGHSKNFTFFGHRWSRSRRISAEALHVVAGVVEVLVLQQEQFQHQSRFQPQLMLRIAHNSNWESGPDTLPLSVDSTFSWAISNEAETSVGSPRRNNA